MTENPLPRDHEGFIKTSADYGHSWMVEIEYSTDFDGRLIDHKKEDYARTFHGPFVSVEEAQDWMDAYPEFTEIEEIKAIMINNVRPTPN